MFVSDIPYYRDNEGLLDTDEATCTQRQVMLVHAVNQPIELGHRGSTPVEHDAECLYVKSYYVY